MKIYLKALFLVSSFIQFSCLSAGIVQEDPVEVEMILVCDKCR